MKKNCNKKNNSDERQTISKWEEAEIETKKKEKVFTLGDSIIKQRKELKTKKKKKTGQTSDEDFVERFRRKDLGKIKLFHLAFTTI